MVSSPSVTVSRIPQVHLLYNTAINPYTLLAPPAGPLSLPFERPHTDSIMVPGQNGALIPSLPSDERSIVRHLCSQEERLRNVCEAQRMAGGSHYNWNDDGSFSGFNLLQSVHIMTRRKKEPLYSLSVAAQQRARISHYLNSTPIESASKRPHSVPTSFLCMSVLTIPERPMPTPVTPSSHMKDLSASKRRLKGLYHTPKYDVRGDDDIFTDLDAPEVSDRKRTKLTTSRSTSFDVFSTMPPVSAPSQRNNPSGLSQRMGTRSRLSAEGSISASTPSHEAPSSSTVVEVTFSTIGDSLDILPPPRLSTRHVASMRGSRPPFRRKEGG
ncbi:hypothetical protein GMRT_13602 [Giardia muris]|uniref:Uncharacterized protein n=1 Tax=Giardia muris TaxID=5742 RepID=A0A4Z1SVZ9_GIAMU|nr:hypothetical protein GMRT_13602 [Giardia muris]|eukprot:TNJ30022.1 hypothetical protein GMRT_13602 [Giardia muris]